MSERFNLSLENGLEEDKTEDDEATLPEVPAKDNQRSDSRDRT